MDCEHQITLRRMIQIQALSDSNDLLMGAAQKVNPHQKSFNVYEIKHVALINRRYVFVNTHSVIQRVSIDVSLRRRYDFISSLL